MVGWACDGRMVGYGNIRPTDGLLREHKGPMGQLEKSTDQVSVSVY